MVMYQTVIHFDLQATETADATVSLSRARTRTRARACACARAACVMLQIYINLYPNFASQTNMDAIHVQVRSEPGFWFNHPALFKSLPCAPAGTVRVMRKNPWTAFRMGFAIRFIKMN